MYIKVFQLLKMLHKEREMWNWQIEGTSELTFLKVLKIADEYSDKISTNPGMGMIG